MKGVEAVSDQCLNINRRAVTSYFILEDATNRASFLFHVYREVEHHEPLTSWKHGKWEFIQVEASKQNISFIIPHSFHPERKERGRMRGRIPTRMTNEDWNEGSTWWKGYGGFVMVRDGQAVPLNRRGTLGGWTVVPWESLIRKLRWLWIKQRCTSAVHSGPESKRLCGFWRLYIALNLPQTDRR